MKKVSMKKNYFGKENSNSDEVLVRSLIDFSDFILVRGSLTNFL